jgi:hypothetical protein
MTRIKGVRLSDISLWLGDQIKLLQSLQKIPLGAIWLEDEKQLGFEVVSRGCIDLDAAKDDDLAFVLVPLLHDVKEVVPGSLVKHVRHFGNGLPRGVDSIFVLPDQAFDEVHLDIETHRVHFGRLL